MKTIEATISFKFSNKLPKRAKRYLGKKKLQRGFKFMTSNNNLYFEPKVNMGAIVLT